jgi:hypothetical protein
VQAGLGKYLVEFEDHFFFFCLSLLFRKLNFIASEVIEVVPELRLRQNELIGFLEQVLVVVGHGN